MKQYGILVVNESAVMRRHISMLIAQNERLFVIGKARNGADMKEKMERFAPSLIVITNEIFHQPFVDESIKEAQIPFILIDDDEHPVPTMAYATIVTDTLMHEAKDELLQSWLYAAQQHVVVEKKEILEVPIDIVSNTGGFDQKQLLIIGSSTGGPSALQHILTQFTQVNVPIVVIQHMPIGFTTSLARRLHNTCQLHVKEVEHEEILQRGIVYIAPAGYQTKLYEHDKETYRAGVTVGDATKGIYKPSIDVTLLSLTPPHCKKTVMVMLTGMGNDGLRGCKKLKQYGGVLLAEAEETCVVYGMPRVVAEAGLVNKQVPLPFIFQEIMYYLQR